jgi:hypothetical protein
MEVEWIGLGEMKRNGVEEWMEKKGRSDFVCRLCLFKRRRKFGRATVRNGKSKIE